MGPHPTVEQRQLALRLHTRADLGVVDAAEKTLTAGPAAAVSEQSSRGMTPPQSAAG
jgi:hypothetical protein